MDDIYYCPDCRAEHQEPIEATLGHVARCLTCAVLNESLEIDAVLAIEAIEEIRVAA